MEQERRDRYAEKIGHLQEHIDDIREWIRDTPPNRFKQEKKHRLATYKAFQEAVEAMADICAMYLSDTGSVVGDDYENIEHAADAAYPAELEEPLKEANGLRNIVVHEYNGINHQRAQEDMKNLLDALATFADAVKTWLRDNDSEEKN